MNAVSSRVSLLAACALALSAMPLAFAAHDGDQDDKHFKMLDANGDGKVTRAEHASGAKKMYTECDANNDGVVTSTDMETSMKKHGDKPGKDDKNAAEKIA